MNFLEQLVAEWYQYHERCFVRTNVKYGMGGKRRLGGIVGEVDVAAYNPRENKFIHIETSTDALTQKDRKRRFQRKFQDAELYYGEIFNVDHIPKNIQKEVIVGLSVPREPIDLGEEIDRVRCISDFIREVVDVLSKVNPAHGAIPETYSLLRAIQFSTFYGLEKARNKKE